MGPVNCLLVYKPDYLQIYRPSESGKNVGWHIVSSSPKADLRVPPSTSGCLRSIERPDPPRIAYLRNWKVRLGKNYYVTIPEETSDLCYFLHLSQQKIRGKLPWSLTSPRLSQSLGPSLERLRISPRRLRDGASNFWKAHDRLDVGDTLHGLTEFPIFPMAGCRLLVDKSGLPLLQKWLQWTRTAKQTIWWTTKTGGSKAIRRTFRHTQDGLLRAFTVYLGYLRVQLGLLMGNLHRLGCDMTPITRVNSDPPGGTAARSCDITSEPT